MVIGITIYLFVFLILWVVGTYLTKFCLSKLGKRNSSTGKAFGIFTVIFYLILFGDYHLSSIVFSRYCSDEELVGLHVYEKVMLPQEMLLPPPKTHQGRHKIDVTLLIDNGTKLIDKDKFSVLYDYQYSHRTTIFPIGPVYKFEGNVIRKADGKLLGKAVEIVNKKGWFEKVTTFGANSGTSCPEYKDKHGYSVTNEDFFTLIDEIFNQQ